MKFSSRAGWAIGLASLIAASAANAQVVSYSGYDALASAPGANSIAARNAFLAATGGSVVVDFERLSTPPAGFSFAGPAATLQTSTSCTNALCGFNTTPGGTVFLQLFGQSATLSFAGGINYFGGFFGGMQLINSISFDDGSTQNVPIPFGNFSDGGFAFAGFTDFNKTITSVDITIGCGQGCDIISVDDLIFGNVSTVPEPSTYAMMLVGFSALGIAARRRRKV